MKDWHPVYELNVGDQHITVSQNLIHSCNGSKLDTYFSGAKKDRIKKVNEYRYEIKRDPEIFKLMIKYIKTKGKMDMSSLNYNDR